MVRIHCGFPGKNNLSPSTFNLLLMKRFISGAVEVRTFSELLCKDAVALKEILSVAPGCLSLSLYKALQDSCRADVSRSPQLTAGQQVLYGVGDVEELKTSPPAPQSCTQEERRRSD